MSGSMLPVAMLVGVVAALGCTADRATDSSPVPDPGSGSPSSHDAGPPPDTAPLTIRRSPGVFHAGSAFAIELSEKVPRDGVAAIRAWVDGHPIPASVLPRMETAAPIVLIRLDGPLDGVGLSGRTLPVAIELDVVDVAGNAATVRTEGQWLTDVQIPASGFGPFALDASGEPILVAMQHWTSYEGDHLDVARWTGSAWEVVTLSSMLEWGGPALAVDPGGPVYVGFVEIDLRVRFASLGAPAIPPIPRLEGSPGHVDAMIDGGHRLVVLVEDIVQRRDSGSVILRLLAYDGGWRELTAVTLPGSCTALPSLTPDAQGTPVLAYVDRECPPLVEGCSAPGLVPVYLALRFLALEGETLSPAADAVPLGAEVQPAREGVFLEFAAGASAPVVLLRVYREGLPVALYGVRRWAGTRWEDLGAPPGSPPASVAVTPAGEVVVASESTAVWRHRSGAWERYPGFEDLPRPAHAYGVRVDAQGRPVLRFVAGGVLFVRRGEPLP